MNDETQTTGTEAPVITDTATTQSSEADVQVTSEAPEAAQSTEETSSEVIAEDTATEERLYAGKYKSAEDMEKAYKELQSKATRDAQEKAELARILNESFATPETAQAATDTEGYDGYEESQNVDPRLDAIDRKTTVQSFIFTHPDADGEAMNKVMAEDPMIANISGYEARLEYAYLKSKASASAKEVAEVRNNTVTETKQKIVEKQSAQVETTRQTSEPTDEKAELMGRMQTGNLTEREAARREYVKRFIVQRSLLPKKLKGN